MSLAEAADAALKQIVARLPEFDWRYDVQRGFYVPFVGLYWTKPIYYVPRETALLDDVQTDLQTLKRRFADYTTHDLPLDLRGGRLTYLG